MKKKKILKKCLSLVLVLSLNAPYFAYADEPIIETPVSADIITPTFQTTDLATDAINKANEYFNSVNNNVLTDYSDTLAILSINNTLDGYTLPDTNSLTLSTETKVSTLSGRILLLNALGQDPRNTLNGRNLVNELLSEQDSNGKFGNYINSHIFAMMALYTSNEIYDFDKAFNVLNDYYIGTINDYGGTKLPNTFGDTDTTAFALIALAPFKNNENLKPIIDECLVYLKNQQLNDGGFAYDISSPWFMGNSNSNSTGTTISALIALGEDVKAEKWTKNNLTPIDALLTFQSQDGGFFYENGMNNDNLSFNQSVIALGDYKNNRSIYKDIISSNYKITKNDLVKEINKAKNLDATNYTSESYKQLEQSLKNATDVYNNETVTDGDIYLATSLLRYDLLNLVKVDNNGQASTLIKVSQEIVTSNGNIISPKSSYEISETSTVFDLLTLSLNLNDIPFTYTGTGTNIYISSIGNYKEFGQGVNSGFEYYVNDVKKGASSAVCPLNSGDTIKWVYTTDYTSSNSSNSDSTLTPTVTPTPIVDDGIMTIYEKNPLDLTNVNTTLDNVYTSYIKKDDLSNFEQIFLKLYSNENNPLIIENLKNEVLETKGEYRKPTDLAKLCLTLKFYEQDLSNINEINLYDKLKNYEDLGKQGVNGYIYTSFVAKLQNDKEYQEQLINKILEYQNEDGGFSLDLNGESDIDITSMALQALALYNNDEINENVEKGLSYLSENIKNNISSESISQILLALALLNIDINDERFLYNNKNLVDRLLEYKYDDISFYHTTNEFYSDNISTEQAVLALYYISKNYNNSSILEETNTSENKSLTRLDFITLLADLNNEEIDYSKTNVFADLNDTTLSTSIVNHFYNKGVVKGTKKNDTLLFNPNDALTKEDFAVYIDRYLDLPKFYRNVEIKDLNKVSSYATKCVIDLVEYSNVLQDKNFNPKDVVTKDFVIEFFKTIN